MKLLQITNAPDLLEIARKAIEDELIELRDSRIGMVRNNGLCIKERDGSPSDIIRLGPEHAMAIGLKAIAKHIGEIA